MPEITQEEVEQNIGRRKEIKRDENTELVLQFRPEEGYVVLNEVGEHLEATDTREEGIEAFEAFQDIYETDEVETDMPIKKATQIAADEVVGGT